MTNPVIFKELPATFPAEDKYKKPAAIGSLAIHILAVTMLVLIPLFMPEHIKQWRLMTLVAPLAPPPPPPAARIQVTAPAKAVVPEVRRTIQVDPGTIITPTEIPKEIARIVDDVPIPVGVTGGVINGNVGGLVNTILSTAAKTTEAAPTQPPPPPPPPPPLAAVTPVRVGGNIKEPKIIKLVQAVYPKLALTAHVTGTVILEATLTAEGTVDEIQVISGNPLLTQAAIDCVKQWRYEPTYLNGAPVPVILTAKVNFARQDSRLTGR